MTDHQTPLEPAAIMADHHPYETYAARCHACDNPYPCEPYRLAVDLAAAQERERRVLRLIRYWRQFVGSERYADSLEHLLAGEGAADQPQR